MRCEILKSEDGTFAQVLVTPEPPNGQDGDDYRYELEKLVLALLTRYDGGSADELCEDGTLTINLVTKRDR